MFACSPSIQSTAIPYGCQGHNKLPNISPSHRSMANVGGRWRSMAVDPPYPFSGTRRVAAGILATRSPSSSTSIRGSIGGGSLERTGTAPLVHSASSRLIGAAALNLPTISSLSLLFITILVYSILGQIECWPVHEHLHLQTFVLSGAQQLQLLYDDGADRRYPCQAE